MRVLRRTFREGAQSCVFPVRKMNTRYTADIP